MTNLKNLSIVLNVPVIKLYITSIKTLNKYFLDCLDPSPSNGFAVAKNGSTLNSMATVSCNSGYTLNGSTVITCTAFGWNDSVTCNLQGKADIMYNIFMSCNNENILSTKIKSISRKSFAVPRK